MKALWRWSRLGAPSVDPQFLTTTTPAELARLVSVEKPGRSRLCWEIYFETPKEARRWQLRHGGQLKKMEPASWTPRFAPIRIGSRLIVVGTEKERDSLKSDGSEVLWIPAENAFGTGDHATTGMILRSLTDLGRGGKGAILDLGCGSGILSLAARKFGLKKIVAMDHDPQCITIGKRNEKRNFSGPLVRWVCSDLEGWKSEPLFDCVLANVYGELLRRYSKPIWRSVASGGLLLMSGILKSEEENVCRAYRFRDATPEMVRRKGKWILLGFRKKG